MPSNITVKTIGTEEVKSLINELPEDAFDSAKQVLVDSTLTVQRRVRARFNGVRLHTRTGEAKRSFKTQVSGGTLKTLRASVFSGGAKPLIYILTHEFGAQIKAKNAYRRVPGGPYLNIPLKSNLTASGVMQKTAHQVFREGGFIAKSRRGNWIVFDKRTLPVFVLKKKVNIPPRLGFFILADREAERIPSAILKLLDRSVT